MYMSYLPCASVDPGGREEKPLSDLVKKVIKGMDGQGRLTEEDMDLAWAEAVGEGAASHSRPVSFKKASIFVNVDRSAWLYELTVRKKEILKKLEGKLRGRKLKDIRFRIGDITRKERRT